MVLDPDIGRARGSVSSPAPQTNIGQRSGVPIRFLSPDPEDADELFKLYQESRLNYRVLDSDDEVQQLVDAIEEYGIEQIALDFETPCGRDGEYGVSEGRLRTIQIGIRHLAFNGYRQWIIDCDKADPRPLRKILKSRKIEKVIHYSPFEQEWSIAHLGCEISNVYDTCLAAQSINKEFGRWLDDPKRGRVAVERVVEGWERQEPQAKPASLSTLALNYLGLNITKEEQESDWGAELDEAQLRYAATDVVLPLDLAGGLRKIAEEQRITKRIDWRCGKARSEAREELGDYQKRSRELAWKLSEAASADELETAWGDGERLLWGIGFDERDQLMNYYKLRRDELAR